MKKTLYFVAPFLLILSGCASTIAEPIISAIVLSFNILLSGGYLLMASTALPVRNKGTLLFSGIVSVTAVIANVYLMNIYYNQDLFQISLPYLWLIK